MQVLKTLIDEALKLCDGNQSKLAKKLQCSTPLMSQMIKGTRSITWYHAAQLAEMTGNNPDEAIKAALIAETPTLKNGALLRDILGKGGAAGGAEVLDSYYKDILTTSITSIKKVSTSVNKNIHRIYQTLGKFRQGLRPGWPRFSTIE